MLYRLMAQDHGRPLCHRAIARRSGLSPSKVHRISKLQYWDSVTLADAEAFARGCGFKLGQHAVILRKLGKVADHGLLSLRHLQSRGKFHRRGGQATLVKSLTNNLL